MKDEKVTNTKTDSEVADVVKGGANTPPTQKVDDVPVKEKPATTKGTKGIVVNCDKLNVRSNPAVKADAVTTIDKGVKVTIDESKSTDDFYSVKTDTNVVGFCMKTYIKVI